LRAVRESDNRAVIVKVLNAEIPTQRQLARFQREYEFVRSLTDGRSGASDAELPGVVPALSLEKFGDSLAIVFEDTGGESLARTFAKRKAGVLEFLRIAIRITDSLGAVHRQKIIHKDINPANIVWNPATGAVYIIDFGIAAAQSRTGQATDAGVEVRAAGLEGTFQYISPEQTGRMNRQLDFRSDFYSLGATFYFLLTGRPPFESNDRLELVHSHLARNPEPVESHNPEVPPVISRIIAKLMAKTADDRYQSSYGIRSDLEECLRRLGGDAHGSAAAVGSAPAPGAPAGVRSDVDFEVGRNDLSDRFHIPDKLYGRDADVQNLMNAFARVAAGATGILLVSGRSGIGKSALVREVHRPITEKRGYFISGKFDQLNRNIPYASIIQAFQELMRQVLAESEERVARWRLALTEVLGSNGQVLVDVIPEIGLILGAQPPVPELEAAEAQNRFHLVFQNFVRTFARAEHPLVMFLDDLQWADLPSLHMLRLLAAGDTKYLLIIGAYRDAEVDAAHPLSLTLDEIRKSASVSIDRMHLDALRPEHVQQLVEDTLFLDHATARSLADLCAQKTNGNPFFLGQFLQRLHEDELIVFDPAAARWTWNLEDIQAMQATDNVAELMTAKIRRLSETTQEALRIAACMGDQFDLRTLATVRAKGVDETASDLLEALVEGLIMPSAADSAALHVVGMDATGSADEADTITYVFLHDRVQQAAYALMDDDEKRDAHRSIGRLMLENSSPARQAERIFTIVNHLNAGRQILAHDVADNYIQLAALNLQAGKKAKASAAYEPAFEYLRTGTELLGSGCWRDHYELALELHIQAAEAAYLSTDFVGMQRLSDVVLENAKNLLEQGRVYRVRIQALIAENRPTEAIRTALYVLKKLGVRFPERPTQLHILRALARTKLALSFRGRHARRLADLPEMSDPIKLETMHILSSVAVAAYVAVPELLVLIAFQQVRISVRHGNTARSAFGYATYGFILAGVLGQIDEGYEFGTLALDLLGRFGARDLEAQTYLAFNSLIRHWKDPLRESLSPSLEGYQLGLETGDLEYACYNAVMYCYISYLAGVELETVEREMRKYGQVVERFKQQTPLHWHNIIHQTVLNLMDPAGENPAQFHGPLYDERVSLRVHQDANDQTTLFSVYFNKLLVAFLLGEHDAANEFALHARRYLDGAVATPMVPAFYFYDALNCLALLDRAGRGPAGPSRRQAARLSRRARAGERRLRRWATFAPANLRHRYEIVAAAGLALRGSEAEAEAAFDRALDSARETDFLQDQALASELLARFWLRRGKLDFAGLHFLKALHGYHVWGAFAKTEQIKREHLALMNRMHAVSAAALATGPRPGGAYPTAGSTSTSSTTHAGGAGSGLDVSTILKASHAISGEIVLADLLRSMMRIVIESAGAQRGFLLLENEGRWLVEAEGHIDAQAVRTLESRSIEGLLAPAVVNYVARTREYVVLEDAARHGQFTADPYVREHRPKSVLCYPLLNQGKLSGIIYLENNLASGSFTGQRLEVLGMLSTSIASALENSRLYGDLQAALDKQTALTNAYSRFVPRDLLRFLGKESIIDVELGDQVQQEMTVLFADIRGFTTLSESMSPTDNFRFINSYLGRMEPIIGAHHGFIDKYIGDAIMALFPTDAESAVQAAIEMLQRLVEYNESRVRREFEPIRIGIGLNTGELMLGTIGGKNRMEGTVISDAVNLASRIEDLNKIYETKLLIGEGTRSRLIDGDHRIRMIDRVRVKGKSKAVTVYEVYDADEPALRERKDATRKDFERGFATYRKREFTRAREIFEKVLERNPGDTAAGVYIRRCEKLLGQGMGV
jgi:predicted ATPase/class 3 adenylate cyclase